MPKLYNLHLRFETIVIINKKITKCFGNIKEKNIKPVLIIEYGWLLRFKLKTVSWKWNLSEIKNIINQYC